MKKPLSALLLASAVVAGCAAPYAPQEFDFSELACAPGIVESVREVDLQAGAQRFEAGERVRVVFDARGARLERE